MTGEMLATDEFQSLLSMHQPGAALKAARLASDTELAAIAQQTLIPLWKLEALESDDYGRLGGTTFINGYVRKYASLLKLDADACVAALPGKLHASIDPSQSFAATAELADQPAVAKYGQHAQPASKVSVGKIPGIPALAVLALCWIVASFLLGESESPAVADAPGTSDSVPALPDTNSAVAPSFAPSESSMDDSEPAAVDTPLAPPEPKATADSTPAEISEPEPTLAPLDDAASTDAQLSIRFSDECWVEVKDANGEVVFAQLQVKGDNLQLFGEAPFEVMLGNARAAEVLINGKPVAVNVRPNRNTLRFTVRP